MKRRDFIKTAAGIWIPNIWIQRSEAQFQPGRSRSFLQQAAAGCTTIRDSQTGAVGSSIQLGNSASRKYVATKISSGSGPYTYCAIDVDIYKTSSPTFTISVELWSHDSTDDDPSAIIGSAGSVAASSLPSSSGTWTNVTIAATPPSYPFWVVLVSSATDGSNYVNWERASVTGRVCNDADGAGLWTLNSTTRFCRFRLYSA